MLAEALELLACPRCGGPLRAPLRCVSCGVDYGAPQGIPELRLPADARTETVREFYAHAPFPGYPPRDSYPWLRARAERSELARLLDQAIPGDARIAEVGCGTGQMSLFLATADRLVIGADLTRASLELAEDARRRYGVERALFVETDLRAPGLRAGAFDVVYSAECCTTLRIRARRSRRSRACSGRAAWSWSASTRVRAPAASVAARRGAADWIPLDPFDPVLRERTAEPARREAWLRDQYRHVEEHRHTWVRCRAGSARTASSTCAPFRTRCSPPSRPAAAICSRGGGRLGVRERARPARLGAHAVARRRAVRGDRSRGSPLGSGGRSPRWSTPTRRVPNFAR